MDTFLMLEGAGIKAAIDKTDGHIVCLEFKSGETWDKVGFRQDKYRGPAWFTDRAFNGESVLVGRSNTMFIGKQAGLGFKIEYSIVNDKDLKITLSLRNHGGARKNLRAGICLGLDTCMVKFPEWNDIYFPTLLHAEPTHFWAYSMNPNGRIVTISSPDPVASWHLIYNSPGHLIYSECLDLLCPGPLPENHPQNLDSMAAGEIKKWEIFISSVDSLDKVKPQTASVINAPIIDSDIYTLEPGQSANVKVFGAFEKAELKGPDGVSRSVSFEKPLTVGDKPGLYTLSVISASGKKALANFSVRNPWSWYVNAARSEAIRMPQKGASHTESWYGLFSCFAAAKYMPDQKLDKAAVEKFNEIFPLMYDMSTYTPTSWERRIQNHACAAGLMAAKYAAFSDIKDLEGAAALADFIVGTQGEDGGYYAGKTHYTSVIYIAKSVMEVMAEEKKLINSSPLWKERYDRHFSSVKRAMDNLVARLDDIETEGEMTYEDGMISCSALQLGMFALLPELSDAERAKYVKAAKHFINGHKSLDQLIIPDSRMNGGTLRFWEAQYDVLMTPNMLNSPHGWSAWCIYAVWYLYLLTGEYEYLKRFVNAIGSCAQLIDFESGVLRWAFIADPQINACHFEEFTDKPGKGRCVSRIVGGDYIPMISDWYKAKPDTFVTGYWGGNNSSPFLGEGESWPDRWNNDNSEFGGDGGCCDNDVHEIFKCLAETALPYAYVYEFEDGRIDSYNCKLEKTSSGLMVKPVDSVVNAVHFNLRKTYKTEVCFGDGVSTEAEVKGMMWVRK